MFLSVVVVLCVRLVFLSFCMYSRKITYKHIKATEGKQNKDKYKTTEISQPEPERYLFAVGSRARYPVFMLLLFVFEFFIFRLIFLSYFWKSWKNDAQRFFAMKVCILQGGQNQGGDRTSPICIYIYIYMFWVYMLFV